MHVFHLCERELHLYPWCSEPLPVSYAVPSGIGGNIGEKGRADIVQGCVRMLVRRTLCHDAGLIVMFFLRPVFPKPSAVSFKMVMPVVNQLLEDKSSTVTGSSLVELLKDLYQHWLLPVAGDVGVTEVRYLCCVTIAFNWSHKNLDWPEKSARDLRKNTIKTVSLSD